MAIDLRPWRALRNQLKQRIVLIMTLLSILLLILAAWGIHNYLRRAKKNINSANVYLSATIKRYTFSQSLQQLKQRVKQLTAQIQFVQAEQHQQQLFWKMMQLIAERMSKHMQLFSLEVADHQFILIGTALTINAVNQYVAELLKSQLLQSVRLVDLRESFTKKDSNVQFKIMIKSKQDADSNKAKQP